MECKNCGAPIPENSTYCENCAKGYTVVDKRIIYSNNNSEINLRDKRNGKQSNTNLNTHTKTIYGFLMIALIFIAGLFIYGKSNTTQTINENSKSSVITNNSNYKNTTDLSLKEIEATKNWKSEDVSSDTIFKVLSNVTGFCILGKERIADINISPSIKDIYVETQKGESDPNEILKHSNNVDVLLSYKIGDSENLESVSRMIAYTLVGYSKVLFNNPKVQTVTLKVENDYLDNYGNKKTSNAMLVGWDREVYESVNFEDYTKLLMTDYKAAYKISSNIWVNSEYRYQVPQLYEISKTKK